MRDKYWALRNNMLVRFPTQPPAHWTLCFGTRERPVAWHYGDFIVVCPTHRTHCRLLERAPGELSLVAFGFSREFCFALAHQLMAQRAEDAQDASERSTQD